MSGSNYRPQLTSAEVEQNVNHIVTEGIEGEIVLDVRVNPGIEAGPFIQVDVVGDVIVIPFEWQHS